MSNYALRIPNSLMDLAKEVAKKENTSLNQLFLTAIAEKLSALETEDLLRNRASKADEGKYLEVLSRVGTGPALPGDELPEGWKEDSRE